MENLQDILEKVAELYRKYGIRSVTMDDVSRELGISKKTLYQFVCDKDELVLKVVEYILTSTFQQLDQICNTAENAIHELFEVNRFVHSVVRYYSPSFEYDLKKYFPEVYTKMITTKREKMYISVLENIKKGKKEGIYRTELQEEIIAKMYVSKLENLHINTMFTIEEMVQGKIFREIFVYHVRGLANKKGIEILEKNIDMLNFD